MRLLLLLLAAALASARPSFTDYDALLHEKGVFVGTETRHGIEFAALNFSSIAASPHFLPAIAALAAPQNTSAFAHEDFLAYYINAYNLLAMKMVIEHPCRHDLFGQCAAVRGIREIGSLFHPVWNMPAGTMNNKTVTLQDVENTLRAPNHHGWPWSEDARIHAAIVCMSISCPNLRSEAYVSERVDAQLTDAMQKFLNNTAKGSLIHCDESSQWIKLSSIFKWFMFDFAVNDSVVNAPLPYVANFVDARVRQCILAHESSFERSYFDYDWNLIGEGLQCSSRRACFGELDAVAVFSFVGIVCIAVGAFTCYCSYKRRNKRRHFVRLGDGDREALIQRK